MHINEVKGDINKSGVKEDEDSITSKWPIFLMMVSKNKTMSDFCATYLFMLNDLPVIFAALCCYSNTMAVPILKNSRKY